MALKGSISAQVASDVNDKMGNAIEDLRVKYAKLAEIQEKADAIQAQEDKVIADEAAAVEAARLDLLVDLREDDPDLENIRKARLAALKDTAKAKKHHLDDGGGEVREIVEEEFLKQVTSAHFVVLHLYHEEFMTCKVMDKHLRILAPKCVGTKILRLNATKAPFFIAKLKVKVLPTVVFFKDGVTVGRQTGFEGLVNSATDEDFPTGRLMKAMAIAGVLGKVAAEDVEEEEGDDAGAGSGAEYTLAEARRRMMAALEDEEDL